MRFVISHRKKKKKKKEPDIHLGHINLYKIQKLVKSKILPSLIPKDLSIYKYCIEGKRTKRPFIAKGYRAKECLECILTCVSLLMPMHEEGVSTSLCLWLITLSSYVFT